MEGDWSFLHKLLSDRTRRSILELVDQKDGITYTEIMTILKITNTGRLNYHLKALGDLLAKDDEGKYHLTERGDLAASLLKTFPERAPPDKKRISALKIAVSIVLILVGILLVTSSILAIVSFPTSVATNTSESGSVSSQTLIPANLTVSLMPWQDSSGDIQIAWSASSPIHIYVFNQTQYDALLLRSSTDSNQSYLENFTGSPTTWVQQYYLQGANTTLDLPQGQYYFFAAAPTSAVLNSFTISQSQIPQQQPSSGFSLSPFFYLWFSILVAVGVLFIVLAFSILTRRVWR